MVRSALLALALTPGALWAACTPSGAPQGYGSAWWSSYKSWCRACGGSVPNYYGSGASCALPAASGPGGSAAGAGPGAEIGQAIGAGIVEMFRKDAAQKKILAEQRRVEQLRLDEIRRQQEAARKAEFDKGKGVLLDKMGGGVGPLELKDDGPEPAPLDTGRVRGLHDRESATRREALERLKGKPEELWCKLHLPQALLMPEAPIYDAGERYPEMMSAFVQKRSEWDRRCGGPSASGPTDLDAALAPLTSRTPPALAPEAPRLAPTSQAPAGKLLLKGEDE
ncbi:MAG TPA: hypothetical protein DCM05_04600 [Elusimicrobia bacterium]|nr:hypothetical protein [Elusimicrobiota bacterium]